MSGTTWHIFANILYTFSLLGWNYELLSKQICFSFLQTMTLKIHSAEGRTSEGLLEAPNVVHSQDSTIARRSTTKSATPPPNTTASIRRMYEYPENWMLAFTGMGQIHEVSFYINDTFIKFPYYATEEIMEVRSETESDDGGNGEKRNEEQLSAIYFFCFLCPILFFSGM